MALLNGLRDLGRGIINHPVKALKYAFSGFSVLFTTVKGIDRFIPSIKIGGPFALWGAVIVSVAYAFHKVWKPSTAKIRVANCNTVIEILFGDVFEQDGIRAIAVNEFFDSKLGKPVSDLSVHGIFLKKCFGGHQEPFDKQVENELRDEQATEVPEKIEGKTACYPIGSTAMITANQDRYLAFAFAKTDPKTCKAYTNVELMWRALYRMWARARVESGGYPINLPLVGSGRDLTPLFVRLGV